MARRMAFLLIMVMAFAVPIALKKDVIPNFAANSGTSEIMQDEALQGYQFEEKTTIKQVSVDEKMNNSNEEVAKIIPFEENNPLWKQKCQRDVLVLMPTGQIQSMELEDYTAGCVFGEMPLSFDVQALMAQSVAVRSFTARLMSVGASKHKNADVCTNPACCQNYVSVENLPYETKKLLLDAVNATKGMIMVYRNEPIEAVYHASSGTNTLDSEDVWGGKVEYLRSVKAPDGENAISENGLGHRVGLSQHGANILAAQGMNYIKILKYYYSGISFDFLC